MLNLIFGKYTVFYRLLEDGPIYSKRFRSIRKARVFVECTYFARIDYGD